MLAVLVFQVSMDRPARSSLQPMTQRVEASTVGDGLELMRTQSAFARRAVRLERMTSRRRLCLVDRSRVSKNGVPLDYPGKL